MAALVVAGSRPRPALTAGNGHVVCVWMRRVRYGFGVLDRRNAGVCRVSIVLSVGGCRTREVVERAKRLRRRSSH